MARPASRFHDFIGQRRTIDPVLRELHGAMARGEPPPHLMLTGPSGVGKSLFMRSMAEECGTRILKVFANEPVSQMAEKFLGLKACDFLFIDECHNLKAEAQEMLFEVIDTRKVPPAKEDEAPAEVQPFTLGLATDRPGSLLNALHKRFPTTIHFSLYSHMEMKEIVEAIATRKNVLLSPQAANALARACNGLPRRAEHLLVKLRLFFAESETKQLGTGHVEEFLGAFRIDEHGLGPLEHRYLASLQETGSASLETLALILGTDKEYVLRQVEPVLLHLRYVTIRPGGRVLTAKGAEWTAGQWSTPQKETED